MLPDDATASDFAPGNTKPTPFSFWNASIIDTRPPVAPGPAEPRPRRPGRALDGHGRCGEIAINEPQTRLQVEQHGQPVDLPPVERGHFG